ncbi:MAG: RNA polymerase sigma factor RpoD/SigA [Acidobacteriia bacterium]|nr:RNA polymerase sigma factor RpoD/SigA [Terriglobia bacterium]
MSRGEASPVHPQRDAELSAAGGSDAAGTGFHDLIHSNLSFVAIIAAEYRNLGLPFEDLLNEGNIGLIEAAYRFDPKRGTKFITYAVWWIRRGILRALADHSRLVRLPEYQRKEIRRVRDAEQILGHELGRPPDSAEISDRLSRSIESIGRLMQSQLRELPIDAPVGDDGAQRISDLLADRILPSPEDAVIRSQALQLVSHALSMLQPREQEVLRYRYGFGDGQGLSLTKVGKRMGLSGERVRQIEFDAIVRLRKMIRTGRIGAAPSKRLRPPHRV